MTEIVKQVFGADGGCVSFKLRDGDSVADLRLEFEGGELVVYVDHWPCSSIASEAASRAQGFTGDDPFEVVTMGGVERAGQLAGKVTFTANTDSDLTTMRFDYAGRAGAVKLGREGLSELALAMAAAAGEM